MSSAIGGALFARAGGASLKTATDASAALLDETDKVCVREAAMVGTDSSAPIITILDAATVARSAISAN